MGYCALSYKNKNCNKNLIITNLNNINKKSKNKIDTKRSSTCIEKKNTHTDMLPLSDFVSQEEHCWQKPAKTKYLRDTFTKSMQLVAISN